MTKPTVGLLGEPNNLIATRFLSALLSLETVQVSWFCDATISPIRRAGLYLPEFEPSPVHKFAMKVRSWLSPGRRPSARRICASNNIQFISPQEFSFNKGLPRRFYTDQTVDYVLVAGCDQILNASGLSVAKRCTINFHWSLLPGYRGKFVAFWQWYNNETLSGYSFHKVDTGIDTGEVVFQEHVSCREGGLDCFTNALVDSAADRLSDVFSALISGKHTRIEGIVPSYYPSSRIKELVMVNRDTSLHDLHAVIERAGFAVLPNGLRVSSIVSSSKNFLAKPRLDGGSIVLPLADGYVIAKMPGGSKLRLMNSTRRLLNGI